VAGDRVAALLLAAGLPETAETVEQADVLLAGRESMGLPEPTGQDLLDFRRACLDDTAGPCPDAAAGEGRLAPRVAAAVAEPWVLADERAPCGGLGGLACRLGVDVESAGRLLVAAARAIDRWRRRKSVPVRWLARQLGEAWQGSGQPAGRRPAGPRGLSRVEATRLLLRFLRWLPLGDGGLPYPMLGGSWAPEAAPGAQALVPCWPGADDFLSRLREALGTEEGRKLARKVGPGVVLEVARVDAATADPRTGRDVLTSHEEVSDRLARAGRQVSPDAVKRARRVVARLGFAALIPDREAPAADGRPVTGRYLTLAERAQAHACHGGRQIAAAARRCLTVPLPPGPLRASPAPRARPAQGPPRNGLPPPTPRSGVKPETGPPRTSPRRTPPTRPPARERPPIPVPVSRLASDMLSGRAGAAPRFPFLVPASPAGDPAPGGVRSLARVLLDEGVDPDRWSSEGLYRAFQALDRREGHGAEPSTIRSPWGFFRAKLRRVLNLFGPGAHQYP